MIALPFILWFLALTGVSGFAVNAVIIAGVLETPTTNSSHVPNLDDY